MAPAFLRSLQSFRCHHYSLLPEKCSPLSAQRPDPCSEQAEPPAWSVTAACGIARHAVFWRSLHIPFYLRHRGGVEPEVLKIRFPNAVSFLSHCISLKNKAAFLFPLVSSSWKTQERQNNTRRKNVSQTHTLRQQGTTRTRFLSAFPSPKRLSFLS